MYFKQRGLKGGIELTDISQIACFREIQYSAGNTCHISTKIELLDSLWIRLRNCDNKIMF